MPLFRPIRYINNGEPLNETVLNRSTVDIQENLEELFNKVEGYDSGVSDAASHRVVKRNEQGTAKFGMPSHEQHPIRVVELEDFREFLLDSNDVVRNERLPKSSTSLEGIVQLEDVFDSTSLTKAPTGDALRRGLDDVRIELATSIDSSTNDKAATPKAVYDYVELRGSAWKVKWEGYASNAAADAQSNAIDASRQYTDQQINSFDPGGTDVSLAGTIFENDDRGVSSNLAATPKAVWDAISNFAGTGDDTTSSSGPSQVDGATFSDGSSGWVSFPTATSTGILIQWGRARTGPVGFFTLTFPVAFASNKYSIILSERNPNGWEFVKGNEWFAPCILAPYTVEAQTFRIDVRGVRIVGGDSDALAPARGTSGIDFVWMAIGIGDGS